LNFISEPITPVAGSFSTELMATGLAALPPAFTWRGRRYDIEECLEHRKVTSPEGGGSPGKERYLRRQEFTVRLTDGSVAVLYVLRQAPGGGAAARRRWFLYTLDEPPAGGLDLDEPPAK
jgi:hypothetical protein